MNTWTNVGLIHMNGRVYDPSLGRFLSADPTIQYPESTQSYNRYSYVHNNPLSYTDPSGFGFFSSLFKAIGNIFRAIRQNFRSILAIGLSIALGPAGLAWNPLVVGFISGVVSGGDLKSGIIGAFTAGAFQAVGGLKFPAGGFKNIVAHGLVGGVSSVAQGGSFKSGFLSGGFGEFAGPRIEGFKLGDVANTIASAVAGGVGSVLGGGKFQNGAITGAFGYLFNRLSHQTDPEKLNVNKNELSFIDRIGETVKNFIKDRLTVTLDVRAAFGHGVDASVKIDKDIFDTGVVASAGSMLGVGFSRRATIDVLVYDGGPISGTHFKGSVCFGRGGGGCGSVAIDPVTKNFRVYISGGFVGGFSAGFRPVYNTRIELDDQ